MRRWCVGPDGDRRQGSESGSVVHQMQRVAVGDDDVVRVLVLGHDLWPAWRQVVGATPVQHVAEGALVGSEAAQGRQVLSRQTGVVRDFPWIHVLEPRPATRAEASTKILEHVRNLGRPCTTSKKGA